MSYDLDHIEAMCPCPCGKGHIIYGSGTNDWNQVREGMIEIDCPDCYKKYKFSKGGLLPVDYPDYVGDVGILSQMKELRRQMPSYNDFRDWGKEKIATRLTMYLTSEEIQNDKLKVIALYYAKDLADKFTLDDLKEIAEDMETHRYSTEVSGKTSIVLDWHKRRFKTVKLKEAIIPVKIAIRNYTLYKQHDAEDQATVSEMQSRYLELEKEYYKNLDAYEEERQKHLIPYKLVDVK